MNANETLRTLIKELRTKFVEKERKLTADVSYLAKEIDRLGKLASRDDEQVGTLKLQYEERFKLLQESLITAQNQIKQKDTLYATERFSQIRLFQLSVDKAIRVFENRLNQVVGSFGNMQIRMNKLCETLKKVLKRDYCDAHCHLYGIFS